MATDNLTPTVASNVKDAMEAAGENLSSLSRATGLTRSVLHSRIYGNKQWWSGELAIIAAHFGLTEAELVTPKIAA